MSENTNESEFGIYGSEEEFLRRFELACKMLRLPSDRAAHNLAALCADGKVNLDEDGVPRIVDADIALAWFSAEAEHEEGQE